MEHQYPNGRAAAFADGWCISCFKRERDEGYSECKPCRDRKDQWCKNRNAARPTKRRTRKVWQDTFDGLQDRVHRERR